MKLTKEGRKLSKDLLRASLTNGLLDAEKVKKSTDTIIASKPRNYIGVLKEFSRLIRLEAAKRHATIESAEALDAAEKAAIAKALTAKFGGDVTTEYNVNPALIGGLRVKVGSDVFDGSVRARLNALEESF